MLHDVGRPTVRSSQLGKMPAVTPWFWIVKILTTGFGEVASDALMRTFGSTAAIVTGVVLVGALTCQFRVSTYIPVVYWSAVVMVAVVGTMATDMPASMGAPLWATSTSYLIAVVGVFALWARVGSLSFAAIGTRRWEGFCWAMTGVFGHRVTACRV